MKTWPVVVILSLTVFAAVVSAQNSMEQVAISVKAEFSNNRSAELERVERDAHRRMLAGDYSVKFPEIREDFEQIQKLNGKILDLDDTQTSVDSSSLLKLVSEINRRGIRLASNLIQDEPKGKKETKDDLQVRAESQEIKPLLNILDRSINRFVHNAMFSNLNVVDSKDALAARNDLKAIIAVSSLIIERAKNQRKADLPK